MRIIITLCIVFLLGCSKSNEPLPAGLEYYPDVKLLKKGLVFKYYYHRGKKVAQPKTDILYRKVILNGDILSRVDFNAGFRKTYEYDIQIDGDKWRSIGEKSISYRNLDMELYKEYAYTITENMHTDWGQDEAYLEKKMLYEGNGRRIEQYQTSVADTLINGREGKVFRGERLFYSIRDNQEQEPQKMIKFKQYEEGLGLTRAVLTNDEMKFDLVLDEIMTIKEFKRRADHKTHRVAYIDTLATMDDHTSFRPCYHPDKINDYYNDKRAGFKGGKGRLRAILQEKLNPAKLEGQSGYLTFRFVVNCKGEAGWFVTEEAGLDYSKKQFSEASRNHLYEILKAEKEWVNLVIRTESRDAYVYITFKIKNGEIIELLP